MNKRLSTLIVFNILFFSISVPYVHEVIAQDSTQLAPPSELTSLCWIAYGPTNQNPDKKIEPSKDSIRDDLKTLKASGFTGLVTYGADGVFGENISSLAQEMQFGGLIMGIWDPASKSELQNAIAAAKNSVTLGYVVGNEGLGSNYDLQTLQKAMNDLRTATGKPVTTTEQIGDYTDPAMLTLGDWVFPNAHAFYVGQLDPTDAVAWTQRVYDDLNQRSKRLVVFKEVGLPTAGDKNHKLNEDTQAQYYQQLQSTSVRFVYFEAFDQPWKQGTSVEPHWGLFQSDRTPKAVVQNVCPQKQIPAVKIIQPGTPVPSNIDFVNIYSDETGASVAFIPSGYMGDTKDMSVNQVWTKNPHSGKYAIKVTYSADGKGPNACDYQPPCKWAGVYWQNPANNWGNIPNAGYNLKGFRKISFWAHSDDSIKVQFGVGGIAGQYPDSQIPAYSTTSLPLSPDWTQYEINLEGADLSYVIGGFFWATNWNDIGAPNGNKIVTFYLDDVRFER